jgi:hypothetical protein
MLKRTEIYFCVMLLLLVISANLFSMASDSGKSFVLYPREIPKWKMMSSLGLSIMMIPRVIAEEEIRQVPMIDFNLRYGLPLDCSLNLSLRTVYITNELSLGLGWHKTFGPISFSIHDKFLFWFGYADMQGFDSKAIGLLNQPGITVGINIDEYLISMKTELLYLLSQKTFYGSGTVGRVKKEITGTVITLASEQSVWKNSRMLLGVRLYYAKPGYQVWLAFSAFKQWMVFPELFIGYIL